MFSKHVIQTAIKKYDLSQEKYQKYFNIVKSGGKFKIDEKFGDVEMSKIIGFDNKGKKIFSAEIAHLACYIGYFKMWSWAWGITHLPKNATWHSRKLFKYASDIVINPNDYTIDILIKSMFLTSRFIINNKYNLDMLLALSMYITKSQGIIKDTSWSNNIYKLNEYYIFYNFKPFI